MAPSTADAPTGAVRCAIYTRKSTEEGLQQAFNSLEAQRDASQAYIASQESQGWVGLTQAYDDGGFTGAHMERPALARLLTDIEAGRVDCVVVYKVDRLSRSLLDFARIMGIFEKYGVSFVSVTQQFNTATSVGRLTLHILLSFAEFERSIISERTRDNKAAARRKGKWTGGCVPLGYDLDPGGGRLIVNEQEAEQVRSIFKLFLSHRSLAATLQEVNRREWRTKSWLTAEGNRHTGQPFSTNSLVRLLRNPIYSGYVGHKGQLYRGEHRAIINSDVWKRAAGWLDRLPKAPAKERNKHGALLKGLLQCGRCGKAMAVRCTTRRERRYRYYVCRSSKGSSCSRNYLAAEAIEAAVLEQLRLLKRPGLGRLAKFAAAENAAIMVDLRQRLRSLVDAVVYDAATAEFTIRLRASARRPQLKSLEEIRFHRDTELKTVGKRDRNTAANPNRARAAPQLPRISRLMALAIRLESIAGEHRDLSYLDLGRMGHVSGTRVTQILNLLHLAPDIQERLLWLEPMAQGREHIHERALRPLAQLYDWRQQRLAFEAIVAAAAVPSKGDLRV